MTKDEAQEEASEKNKTLSTQLCPLMNDICRKHCVCYQKSFVVNSSQGYYTTNGFCNNYQFRGPVVDE